MENCTLATFSLEQKKKNSILKTLEFRFEGLSKAHKDEH